MRKARKSHANYRFIGLNVDDELDDARAFVRQKGWDWPQIRDPDRELAGRLGQRWQPVVVVIHEGEVVGLLAGGGDDRAWTSLARRAGVW